MSIQNLAPSFINQISDCNEPLPKVEVSSHTPTKTATHLKGQSSFWNIAKIVGIALLALSQSFAYVQAHAPMCPNPQINPSNPFAMAPVFTQATTLANALNNQPYAALDSVNDHIRPYVAAILKSNVQAKKITDTQQFPLRLSTFIFPEYGNIGNGELGCKLNLAKPNYFKYCTEIAHSVNKWIQKTAPTTYSEAKAENDKGVNYQMSVQSAIQELMNEEQNRHLNAYGFKSKELALLAQQVASSESMGVILGSDPDYKANFQKALTYLEKKMLQNHAFYAQKDEEILDMICQLSSLLDGKTIKEDASLLPESTYRDRDAFISYLAHGTSTSFSRLREDLIHILKETKTPENLAVETLAIFDQSVLKLENINNLDFDKLDTEELLIWQKLGYTTPFAMWVPLLMEDFVEQWKELASQNIHPIALAAWVHTKLIQIHPFNDGNGRIARLLLNGILVKSGFQPLVFTGQKMYCKAIKDESKTPGSFAKYLMQNTIPWNNKHLSEVLQMQFLINAALSA